MATATTNLCSANELYCWLSPRYDLLPKEEGRWAKVWDWNDAPISLKNGYHDSVVMRNGVPMSIESVYCDETVVSEEVRRATFWWNVIAECSCGCGGFVEREYNWIAAPGGTRCTPYSVRHAYNLRSSWCCSWCGYDGCNCESPGMWPFVPSDKCC